MKLTNELRDTVVKQLLIDQLTDLLHGDLPVKIQWNSDKIKHKIKFHLEMKEIDAPPAAIRAISKVYDKKIKKLRTAVEKFYDIHC